MIVVTTPTGQIGAGVVRGLLDRNEPLRVIVRDHTRLAGDVRDRVEIVEGSHRAGQVLDAAMPGADALVWLMPPDPGAPSAMEHYMVFADAAHSAIERHGVGHVVAVSSAGHGWTAPAGVLPAAFAMDTKPSGSGAAYRSLALPFYMDNLLGQLPGICKKGSLALPCAADRPLATVAVRDVAQAAVHLLTDRSWTGQEDLPLFRPRPTHPCRDGRGNRRRTRLSGQLPPPRVRRPRFGTASRRS